MRNADEIINELEYQREEKIKTINALRQKIASLEEEVDTYDNLLVIPPNELSKFASVIANLGNHPVRRPMYTQPKQEEPIKEPVSTVEAIHNINKELKQSNTVQQPVQQKKDTKKNTGFGGIMKKKDIKQENSEKKQPNYYDDGDDDWGNGEFY